MDFIHDATRALKNGEIVILHDGKGRENEADMLLLAEKATPALVRRMRKDAGGLICLAVEPKFSKKLGLKFANEMLSHRKSGVACRMCKLKMPYGDHPAFSISINHLSTFTGISDNDRAKTISEFGKLVKRNGGAKEFQKNFRAVGHVFLLVGRGLKTRRGHTELSLELARRAKTTGAIVLCEMLSDTGKAASREEAEKYAAKNNLVFIDGRQLHGGFE